MIEWFIGSPYRYDHVSHGDVRSNQYEWKVKGILHTRVSREFYYIFTVCLMMSLLCSPTSAISPLDPGNPGEDGAVTTMSVVDTAPIVQNSDPVIARLDIATGKSTKLTLFKYRGYGLGGRLTSLSGNQLQFQRLARINVTKNGQAWKTVRACGKGYYRIRNWPLAKGTYQAAFYGQDNLLPCASRLIVVG